MQSFVHAMRLARHDFFKLRRHREAPAWAMWVMTFAVSMAWGLGMLTVTVALSRRWPTANWLAEVGTPFLITALVIGVVFHVVYTVIERRAPDRFLSWANGRPGPLVSLFYAATAMLCVGFGLALSYLVLGNLPGVKGVVLTPQRSWLSIAVISVFVSVLWGLWAWQEWHEEQLKRQAQEAQLRLLQGQIEPHFLFNTLANVQSLMDHDLPKAREMLASFTDYLRASLGALRNESSRVADELELARTYLLLLQARMEERLRFSIEADEASRALPLPSLLLQPLVENAIVHGLEPSIEGGQVRVSARVQGHHLLLEVQDDGRGLQAATRPARRGAGMALSNIRQRLQARYGPEATLQLLPAQPGTLARITIPLEPR